MNVRMTWQEGEGNHLKLYVDCDIIHVHYRDPPTCSVAMAMTLLVPTCHGHRDLQYTPQRELAWPHIQAFSPTQIFGVKIWDRKPGCKATGVISVMTVYARTGVSRVLQQKGEFTLSMVGPSYCTCTYISLWSLNLTAIEMGGHFVNSRWFMKFAIEMGEHFVNGRPLVYEFRMYMRMYCISLHW